MNNKRLLLVVACIWLGMVAQPANAKGLNYTYAEIGPAYADADHVDGFGVTAAVSYAAMDFVHVKLAYSRFFLDVDDLSTPGTELDVDLDRFLIGVGGNYSVTEKIDVLATVSYIDAEFSGDIPSESDDGYQIDAGIRALVTKKLELNATGTSLHIDGDTDSGFGAGAVYKLKKKLSLTGNGRYLSDDDELEFFAGLRLKF